MTSLGLKIVGAELETTFSASSREEFDTAIARLTAIAEGLWTLQAPQPKSENISNSSQQPSYADERLVATTWRESQGLR